MVIYNDSAINQSIKLDSNYQQEHQQDSQSHTQQQPLNPFLHSIYHLDFSFQGYPFLEFSSPPAIDNNIKDFKQFFQIDNHNHNSIRKNSNPQLTTTTSGRSSSSDLNSSISGLQQYQQQEQINHANQMNHQHSFSISSEHSVIETSNLPDSNNNVNALRNPNGRNSSIAESDLNISPVLANGPFELDPSLWSAAAASSSIQMNKNNNINTDLNTSPGYRYRPEITNNTSPTFTAGNGKQGFNDFNLNSFQNQHLPQAIDTNSNLRRFSETIWNHDQQPPLPQQHQYQQHSRQSSINNQDLTSSQQYTFPNSSDVSPIWSQFNNDWKSKPNPSPQQLQQQQNYRNMYYNTAAIEDLASSAAAQRRHSYAAVGDNQWATEGFGGLALEGGYFNYQQLQQQLQQQQQAQQQQQQQQQQSNQSFQPPQFGSNFGGHIQRLSADFGNLGLNPTVDESQSSQPHESSTVARNAFKSVDYYFTNDEFQRVHITDASTADLPSTLDALSKKGAQLPRFPGNSIPGAKLVLVGFKAGRVDVFYSPENSQMILRIGDLVFVEADRGQDLGKIVRLDVSIDEARLLKLRQHQEQQLALADNEQLGFVPNNGSAQQQQQPVPSLHFPKPVIKFAEPQQVSQVPNKQADEEKARRVCSLKVRAHGLVMQVVDLEYQWDRRKLTFYYAANQRIDFRELVKELFRIYKTRIWMCAVSGGLNAIKEQQQRKLDADDMSESSFNTGNTGGGGYNYYLNTTSHSIDEPQIQ